MTASYLPSEHLKPLGIGRMDDNGRALLISFNRVPTDQELRMIHDAIEMVGYSLRQDNPAHEAQG